jgi:hypothetical protein
MCALVSCIGFVCAVVLQPPYGCVEDGVGFANEVLGRGGHEDVGRDARAVATEDRYAAK